MTEIKGYSMTRFWRLAGTEGRVSGTWWVCRPDEKRDGRIDVNSVDVSAWDEDHTWGYILGSKDVMASVTDGTVDLGYAGGRWADRVREDAEDIKAAVLAAANAIEWEADDE